MPRKRRTELPGAGESSQSGSQRPAAPPQQPPQQQPPPPQQQGGGGHPQQGGRGSVPQQQGGGYQGGRGSAPQGGRGGYGGGRGGVPQQQYGRGGPPQQQGGRGGYSGGRGGPSAGGPSRPPVSELHQATPAPYQAGVTSEPAYPASSSSQPPEPSEVAEQLQQVPIRQEETPSQAIQQVPVSSKALRFPLRPGKGQTGTRCIVKANHLFAELPDKDLHQYDVTITPEVTSRCVNRAVMSQLVNIYKDSHLSSRLPAYDGRKSLYTAGPLPFQSKEFKITLLDEEEGQAGQARREREFRVVIKFAARADLHHLGLFLQGRIADAPQDALVECPDMSSTAFIEPLPVIEFVTQLLNRDVQARPLSDSDRVKIKKALRGVKVEVTHRGNMRRKYRISGLTSQATRELAFPVDERGTMKSVVEYFHETYGFAIQHPYWPCLQVGNSQRPNYLPMEVCKIVEGQRYSKRLNERQITALRKVTCQRPQERERDIMQFNSQSSSVPSQAGMGLGVQAPGLGTSGPAHGERNETNLLLSFPDFVDRETEGRRIGKLLLSSNEIAKGSNGTIVLEGIYDGRPVAVKRLVRTHHDVAMKEIQNLIVSDHHPNIVRWYGVEHDRDFVYLSLERCFCSLNDLIYYYSESLQGQIINQGEDPHYLAKYRIQLQAIMGENKNVKLWKTNGYPSPQMLKLMSDLVSGLAHLHELGIIHRDLKPQNVLIIKMGLLRAKLSDMGISKRLQGNKSSITQHATGYGSSGWQAPEQLRHQRQTRAVDLFSLGCLLFFCLTGGKHPYGDSIERDVNILHDRKDLSLVENIPEAVDLFTHLLNPTPEMRPTAVDVLHHPFFWNSETRLSFLRDASDRVVLEDRETSQLSRSLESTASVVALDGKWNGEMEPAFLNHINPLPKKKKNHINTGPNRRYKFDSIRDLLRVIRNKSNHYCELSKEIQELLGTVPEGFDSYFSSRFPKLLIEVYKVLYKYCKEEEFFRKYMNGNPV